MGKEIYPDDTAIFKAFNLCTLLNVQVVILGQDPFIRPNQADGLCFSVQIGVRMPPSLGNIFKEIQEDLGCTKPQVGELSQWAKQGVLLLNCILSVEAGKAASHRRIGWEKLSDAVIKKVSNSRKNVVFMLWGKFAKSKKHLIDGKKHLVLEAAHPSPKSAYRGFFGTKHFSQCNEYLEMNGQKPIDWQIKP